jgi:hypothetical protein
LIELDPRPGRVKTLQNRAFLYHAHIFTATGNTPMPFLSFPKKPIRSQIHIQKFMPYDQKKGIAVSPAMPLIFS